MKALDKLHDISKSLQLSAVEAPEKEAEIILRSVLETSLVSVYRDNPELTPNQSRTIEQIVSRRMNREPLQYIFGNVDFMGMKLHVGPGVLIPRPETELMAEYAIKAVSTQRSAVRFEKKPGAHDPKLQTPNSKLQILDLCTGSGCLALALAKQFADAKVYGVDISETALLYARRNAELNGVTNVEFIAGNLFEPFQRHPELVSGSQKEMPKQVRHDSSKFFDLIISNPPYIKTADIRELQPEIREWEPVNALDGGTDGLDYYRAIIPAARNFLKENGMLVLELGIDCAKSVKEMFRESGYSGIESIKDLAGIERISAGKR
jgi:release factor glutamine methyltransferase